MKNSIHVDCHNGITDADLERLRAGDSVELTGIGVRGVDDGRARAKAARLREQVDRTQAGLGEAFLDLARLLRRVNMEREPFAIRVAAERTR